MLVRKNRKVAMKSKRRWKKFWGERLWNECPHPLLTSPPPATLKGASLLLYQCDEESALREDAHVDQTLGRPLPLSPAPS